MRSLTWSGFCNQAPEMKNMLNRPTDNTAGETLTQRIITAKCELDHYLRSRNYFNDIANQWLKGRIIHEHVA